MNLAVLLVAGNSTRFDAKISKQLFKLANKPVFSYPLLALSSSNLIDKICVVTNKDCMDEISLFIKTNNISKASVILGGNTRQESVKNGLDFYANFSDNDYVLIHDGARPLIDENIIKSAVSAVKIHDAITFAITVEDTIGITDDNNLEGFQDRSKLVKIQTPQAFKLGLIRKAHLNSKNSLATDDCSLVKALPHDVKIIAGSKKLSKITTLEDINYLETFIK